MTTTTPALTKRYHLQVPTELFDEVQKVADRKGLTVVEVIRKSLKLGLLAARLEDDPDSQLIIRRGDTEREVVLLM